jgi:hypothetical protein
LSVRVRPFVREKKKKKGKVLFFLDGKKLTTEAWGVPYGLALG